MSSESFSDWTADQASDFVREPVASDDKYSHGVLGVITGSDQFPGAAVLGVEAAWRTGVGMLRYSGPQRAADHVLQRRPETVTAPGRVQAWLIGSGMSGLPAELGVEPGTDEGDTPGDDFDPSGDSADRIDSALRQWRPTVLDAGGIPLVRRVAGHGVITPHHGELASLLGTDRATVSRDPEAAATAAWNRFGVTVLLKGNSTVVVGRRSYRLPAATPWLATAGTGDVLAGIIGTMLAQRHCHGIDAFGAAQAAVWLHGDAARRAGPVLIADDLAPHLPAAIAACL